MNEKEKNEIRAKVTPLAVLQGLTPEAIASIPAGQRIDDLVVITRFPFRIGRESRMREVCGDIERVERTRPGEDKPNNDLYLLDTGQRLNISRQHLQIEREELGYQLVDLGSKCGTKLEGVAIGGSDTDGRHSLHDGDTFVLGTTVSPYIFRFIVLEGENSALFRKDEIDWID